MSDKPTIEENPFVGWVPLDEAAQIVGFSQTALRYWANQGYVQAYQVGQRVRLVNVEEVTAYAAERRKSRKLNKYRGKRR